MGREVKKKENEEKEEEKEKKKEKKRRRKRKDEDEERKTCKMVERRSALISFVHPLLITTRYGKRNEEEIKCRKENKKGKEKYEDEEEKHARWSREGVSLSLSFISF